MIKFIKINRFLVLLAAAAFVGGCADSDFEGTDYPATAYEAKGGSLVQVTDVVTGFYDSIDPSTSSIGFTINTEGGEDVSSMDVQVDYNGKELFTLTNVNSFPATVTAPFTDVLNLTGVGASEVAVGDQVKFSFNNIATASGSYGTSETLTIPVACDSKLGGTFDYVSTGLAAANGYDCPAGEVTGQVTFTPQGGGVYLCSDLGFGQYESSCWNDGPATSGNATFTDVCNKITSGGLDQYSLVYTWVITGVSGADLSMTWSNNYGDSGNVVITRPDGSSWPALFTE